MKSGVLRALVLAISLALLVGFTLPSSSQEIRCSVGFWKTKTGFGITYDYAIQDALNKLVQACSDGGGVAGFYYVSDSGDNGQNAWVQVKMCCTSHSQSF